jgi:sugar-specific transcriptional regulator TrmB
MMLPFLEKLDLDRKQAQILELLITEGELHIPELIKKTRMSRIMVFRILASLEELGFVSALREKRPIVYRPLSLSMLEEKVEAKRTAVQELAESYINALGSLEKVYGLHANEIKVIHYTGREEARELCWNMLQATSPVKSFGYRSLRESLGIEFLVNWWNETVRRKIATHFIANPETYRLKSMPGPVTQDGFLPEDGLVLRRYFDEADFPITTETFIYNDIFATLHWDDTNIFGVEIHHPAIARQQEAIFDFLWTAAREYEG